MVLRKPSAAKFLKAEVNNNVHIRYTISLRKVVLFFVKYATLRICIKTMTFAFKIYKNYQKE